MSDTTGPLARTTGRRAVPAAVEAKLAHGANACQAAGPTAMCGDAREGAERAEKNTTAGTLWRGGGGFPQIPDRRDAGKNEQEDQDSPATRALYRHAPNLPSREMKMYCR